MWTLTNTGRKQASNVNGTGQPYAIMAALAVNKELDLDGIMAESNLSMDRAKVLIADLERQGYIKKVKSE